MPLKMQSHTVSRSRACQGTLGCRGRRRGTVMLEFTLVFLVFFVVLLTLLEMARGMWTYVTIANAARQAGAYCMVRGTHNPATLADVQTVVDRWCMGLDASEVSVSTTWNPDDATPITSPADVSRGDIVQVRITYPFRLITGDLVIDGGTIPMGSVTRMVVAN